MTTHFIGEAISRQSVSKGGNFCAIFELQHTVFEIFVKNIIRTKQIGSLKETENDCGE